MYAEVCSILHSSRGFSFRSKLLILRYCKDPDAEKRKASPCRKIMPFTELFQYLRREVCRCGTVCWHGISCNVAGNLECAPFPAHSMFYLISARCDSFCGYLKQKPACVISRRGISSVSLRICTHFSYMFVCSLCRYSCFLIRECRYVRYVRYVGYVVTTCCLRRWRRLAWH